MNMRIKTFAGNNSATVGRRADKWLQEQGDRIGIYNVLQSLTEVELVITITYSHLEKKQSKKISSRKKVRRRN